MCRIPAIVALLAALASAVIADKGLAAQKDEVTLELELPRSAPPPITARDRVPLLEIDGKRIGSPRSTRARVTVPLPKGASSVKVVYTFWPTTYTRIIRTKVFKAELGKTIKANMTTAAADSPDKIQVIYVTTPHAVVEAMCRLAKVTKDDVVYDIGCGDGRMVIHAVKKYGAKKGVGIDLMEDRIKESKANAKKEGVDDKVTFEQKDALTIKDFSEATAVLLYLGDSLNQALRPALQKTLKPGARIVSHRFLMGNWKPETTQTIRARDDRGRRKEYTIHRWVIRP
jgi:precorrin-6B methylase 2